MTISERFARRLLLDHCDTPIFEVNLLDIYDLEKVKQALEALGTRVEIIGRQGLKVHCPETGVGRPLASS